MFNFFFGYSLIIKKEKKFIFDLKIVLIYENCYGFDLFLVGEGYG